MTTSDTVELDTLVRLADSLEASVLPYVENHYARLQVRAAAQMLLSLSMRLRWAQDDDPTLRASLSTLAQLELASSPQAADDLQTLRARFAEAMPGLYDTQHDAQTRELGLQAAWAVIRREFDAESARLKTGMYA